MVKEFATRHGSALRSLAVVVGTLATAATVIVAAVLAVVFAATVAVIASALLAFAGLAMRARATAQAQRSDGLIEARHLGGHHWVAYGWNERS